MNKNTRILVADDEQAIRESLGTVLKEEGYEVSLASNGKEAVELLTQESFDIIFCDIKMPKADGFFVLKKAIAANPSVSFIVITAFGDMDSAISALKYGAFDYIVKPLIFDDILIKIDHLLKYKNLVTENQVLKREIEEKYNFDQIVGQGPEMREVYSLMRTVSATDSTLLITGERGTGKKVVAKAIHYNSSRRTQNFMGIHCGTNSEEILHKKLFGFQEGKEYFKGIFVQAHKGTLFLDDIDRLSKDAQDKVLQVIGNGEVFPCDSKESHKVDVRIVAASAKDLSEEVANGHFNEKLFDKINSCEIKMPPLRARRNDIPFLIKYFIRKFNDDLGAKILFIEEDALKILMNYIWPGNIRELASVIERAMIITSNATFLTKDDLPLDLVRSLMSQYSYVDNIRDAMKIYEMNHIKEVLARNNHDKRTAADALGLSLSSLYRKLEELSIH